MHLLTMGRILKVSTAIRVLGGVCAQLAFPGIRNVTILVNDLQWIDIVHFLHSHFVKIN